MKKVIIIGAGPAGLTTAYELLKDNGKEKYEVIVLEETSAIGGISKTVKHGNNRMDIGGHRFFSKDDEVMKWWSTLMPLQGKNSFDDDVLGREKPLVNGGPNPESEDRVMLVRGRVSRIYYLKKFFDYPISMKPETFKNMGFARTVKAGLSYLKSMVFKREETSLENFYINRFGKGLYGMFFEGYTEKLWGRHPSEIDASWGAQRVKGLSIFALIKDMFHKLFGGKKDNKKVETSLIEQYWYPKYGPGQLWETVASEIENMGGKIVKNCQVKGVVCEDNKVKKVVCDTPLGEKGLEGDIFISSMPVKDLVEGISGEKPSEEVLNVASGLPYRDFITVGLLVKRLNLENKTNIKTLGNIVPDCWIYVQEPDVKLGRIQIFNNWSPYMVEDPQNTVWIGLEYFCNEGDEYWNMDDESYIKFAISELEKMGIVKAEDVLDAHREKVKKAYPAYFDTYDEIGVVVDYLKSINNLYCVGRNGQHRYNNMDHSMVTAMRAVDCIKGKIDDVDLVWNVNTEKEYHEKKEEK
ncbi:MAG: NAD(P)/FAD-dependent oxidoreductase [Clostridia bacterium]|nr:NAD(P)/FAD-dependent oxidoreductase [Clostridia bacterium]